MGHHRASLYLGLGTHVEIAFRFLRMLLNHCGCVFHSNDSVKHVQSHTLPCAIPSPFPFLPLLKCR